MYPQVRTTEGSAIPAWLEFSASENVLSGIPAPSDAGQSFLEITCRGLDLESSASTTFALVVRDVTSHTSGSPLKFKKTSGPEIVRCKRSEPETVATIIVDTGNHGYDLPRPLTIYIRHF